MSEFLAVAWKAGEVPELLGAAGALGGKDKTDLLFLGEAEEARRTAARWGALHRIPGIETRLADTGSVAGALAEAQKTFSAPVVLFPSTRRGKETAGRLAQILGAGVLTDVHRMERGEEGSIRCHRNALGGAAVSVQRIGTAVQVIALDPGSFEAAPEPGPGPVTDLPVPLPPGRVVLREARPRVRDTVDIAAANCLVAVGLGLDRREDLALVERLARAIGGEIACSKPVATDRKWLPEDRIIGLSGKKCRPALAVLLGISGQVQFTVGIRDAKTVLSVNTDENAAIVPLSDYVFIADLREILPELAGKMGAGPG
jgi:electron transfer flavoprotein alpha subunit